MDRQQRMHTLYVLALQRLTFSNPRNYTAIWQACKSFDELYSLPAKRLLTLLPNATHSMARELQQRKQRAQVYRQTVKDFDWLERNRAAVLTLFDDDYPELLKTIDLPPPVLMACGDVKLLSRQQVAIVGSRKASTTGLENAEMFAAGLAEAGLVVTSGLALGIDAAAHRGAIKSQSVTTAVVGTGLDICYPARHRQLAQQIIDSGVIISEFPLGQAAKKENFPRRNRIISGLSLGVLVAEAEIKSGSLITANYALDQGREVWAIPGSLKNPGAKGCHHLIRCGATLVESPQDIVEDLGFSTLSFSSNLLTDDHRQELTPAENKLLPLLHYDGQTLDQLAVTSGLSCSELTALLINMEIKGWISFNPEGYSLR